jgi:hypothetical protein
MVLSLMSAALADCAEPVTAQRISQEISLGEAAYQNMDEAGFRQAFTMVRESLPCVNSPFNSAQATAFWRMHALAAFLDRDEDAAVIAFQSVLSSTPGYSLSEALAPMGHPLQVWLELALVSPSSLESVLATPASGSVFIDGTASLSAPLARPYLFQLTDESGQLLVSQVIHPGQEPPRYPVLRERPIINAPLAITAGVSGVIAGGTWYLATAREDTFWDPSTPTSDLELLQRQSNTLGTVALSAGILTVGSGAAAVLVGSW